VRIVAGTLGGRVLAAPPGRSTRPTSEKVREAIFSILGPPPEDAQVLDLFAGSGALAIEALSRGAAAATLVESARGALATLRANLRDLALEDRARVVAADALTFLRAAHAGPAFHWVFLDPPYASRLGAEALALLGAGTDRLAPEAITVIEHDRRNPPPDAAGDLLRTDQRRYGDTLVSFYRRRPGQP
jgi:16S rRNA (guanine(966)-N(2))-methyltransferase RsmD